MYKLITRGILNVLEKYILNKGIIILKYTYVQVYPKVLLGPNFVYWIQSLSACPMS